MRKLNENYLKINLPKKPLSRIRLCAVCFIFLGCALFFFFLLRDRNFNLFYIEITFIRFLFFVSTITLISGNILINMLYQRPVLLMSSDRIYIGTIKFFRRPRIQDSGISPFSDMKLILVKDSASQKTWLMLEGRKIVDLGLFDTNKEAEYQRQQIRRVISNFFPELYISAPIYQEI